MTAKAWVKEISINDGSQITFDSNDIVVIVGSNNSGKSSLLREINSYTTQKNYIQNAKILTDIIIGTYGTDQDLIETVEDRTFKKEPRGDTAAYFGYRFSLIQNQILNHWQLVKSIGLGGLQPIFIQFISSDSRLGIANTTASIDILNNPPSHPIHFLYKSKKQEVQFSEAFQKAFGTELIVNRGSGSNIHLHVGTRPLITKGEDELSESYLKDLKALPTIQEQGDGMRSFVGLLLETSLGKETVSLIDEPEVFLHPPQARLLGRMLVTDLPDDKQLFIATHSEDFLKGLLDSNSNRIKVLRIQRDGNINHIKELSKEQLKTTWKDPLLRHSNILSGLFHSKVILCEGDADCRFYSALVNALIENDYSKPNDQKEFKTQPDILFIHCGGKQRMPIIIHSLKKLNVPVLAVCDFDILNNESPLKEIFEELDGVWGKIEKEWKIVKSQVDSKKPELDSKNVKEKIGQILASVNSDSFPSEKGNEISELLKKTSAWSIAKGVGKNFVPSGDATRAYLKLIRSLCDMKLFVVEIGELEGFARSISNHGPKWVNEVLQKNLIDDIELSEARAFVKKLIE